MGRTCRHVEVGFLQRTGYALGPWICFFGADVPVLRCGRKRIRDVIGNADEERPDLFWRIYGSFDEGEYYHDGNRQEDPAEAYTRPMIADILKTLDGK
jgi:hypothetical protein